MLSCNRSIKSCENLDKAGHTSPFEALALRLLGVLKCQILSSLAPSTGRSEVRHQPQNGLIWCYSLWKDTCQSVKVKVKRASKKKHWDMFQAKTKQRREYIKWRWNMYKPCEDSCNNIHIQDIVAALVHLWHNLTKMNTDNRAIYCISPSASFFSVHVYT